MKKIINQVCVKCGEKTINSYVINNLQYKLCPACTGKWLDICDKLKLDNFSLYINANRSNTTSRK